jgi:tetratricopeptide (TPR) repeat protein
MAMLTKLAVCVSMALPLLAQTPSPNPAGHAKAAIEAERRNDFATAVREYKEITAVLPRSAEMQSNLGVALYFNHDLPGAIRVFHTAINLNPKLFAPHLFSGLAWFRLSQPDAAVLELETAIRLNPSDVIARTWLGYAYNAQLRPGPALQEFRRAQELDPDNIDVWSALGETYLELGRQATQKLLTRSPDGARSWQLAGEQLQLNGNPKGALEDFRAALQRRPELEDVRAQIAELGGKVDPITLLHSARDGSTAEEDALYQQAHGAEQQAHAAFEHVIQTAPGSYRAHQIMADALSAQEHHEQAIEEYREVLRTKPDLPGIHEAIGNSLLRIGKADEAVAEFRAELDLQPRSAAVYTDLGQALLIMGNDNEAAKMLAKALGMDRPPPEIYRLMGKVDLHLKNYSEAVRDLNHFLQLKPGDSNSYYLLSKAYRSLGDKTQMQQALTMFEKTSREAKERSRAQTELEAQNRKQRVDDTVSDQNADH